MVKYEGIVDLVLAAVALAMGVASVVLGVLGGADLDTHVTLLGIGLFALALVTLQRVGGGLADDREEEQQ